MKTAVSIPDEIFVEAERLAEQLRTSRSRLYSQALREFVRRHAPEHVTESMNRVIDEVGSDQDGFSQSGSASSIAQGRVVISQGEVWWAELLDPVGSAPVYGRPVIVMQCDALNQSRIGTVICVPLTSNLKWAEAPGNVALSEKATGLPKRSVANVSLVVALDKGQLSKRVGRLSRRQLDMVLGGSTSCSVDRFTWPVPAGRARSAQSHKIWLGSK